MRRDGRERSKRSKRRWLPAIGRLLASLLATLGLGHVADASTRLPSPDDARSNIEQRLEDMRKALVDLDGLASSDDPTKSGVAQWLNWPDWGNWPNWNDWFNWGDWPNWYNY